MTNRTIASKILEEQASLKSARSNYETVWRRIAEEFIPSQDIFFNNQATRDFSRYDHIFDGSGQIALSRYSAAMDGLNTPRGQAWHGLEVGDATLNANSNVRRYLDEVRDILFTLRYASTSSFSSEAHAMYTSLGAFGTGVLFVDDNIDGGILYKHIHISEMFLSENVAGIIDSVYRKFTLTARQAREMQENEDWELPKAIIEAADKNPEERFAFVHHVAPNRSRDKDRLDAEGMQYKSWYISVEDTKIVSEGGFRTFPYMATRIMLSPNQVFGDSPAMQVIGDVRYLQESDKTSLKYGQLNASPAYAVPHDTVFRRADIRPDALVYGGMDPAGNLLMKPIPTGNDPRQNELNIQRKKQNIDDAFLLTLFQILANNTQETATEVLQKAQEQGLFLGSIAGRLQSEWFASMIDRELDIANAKGLLPDMPDELIEASENGQDVEIKVVFTSPLSQVLDAQKAAGTIRTVETIGQLSQLYPSIVNSINPDEIPQILADANGMPNKVLRSKEEIEQLNIEQQQQQQQQELLAAAPAVSSVAKDVSSIQNAA